MNESLSPRESFYGDTAVARDNLFRYYSISGSLSLFLLRCSKKMENVINFFGLAAQRSSSRSRARSCYRSVLHARTIVVAPAAIDIFFPTICRKRWCE